jgi:TatD DNase family protein|tara:strand:- start:329 stop:1096 length:768 start_codon:yes stop_codon:yes gene_type:complete
MKIIDTHCHLDFSEFASDRDDVLKRARQNGLCGFVIPGVMRRTWDALIELCDQSSDMHYALGLHPMFIQTHELAHVENLREFLVNNSPIAIGEIGLDFQDRCLQIEKQKMVFELQLKLACEMNLPVILHVRKAHEEVLACLRKFPVSGGIVHAFNGSLQQAERYQQHNFKFGFGGMLTYARSSKLRKLASELPIESIVLETDSPDMTVEQHRGERNSPEYLTHCLTSLAEVRNLTLPQVAHQTTLNACDVLKLTV